MSLFELLINVLASEDPYNSLEDSIIQVDEEVERLSNTDMIPNILNFKTNVIYNKKSQLFLFDK